MARVQVNFDDLERVDLVVDLDEWHGKAMDRAYITEAIQRIISEFEQFEDHEPVGYSLCGDTLIVVTRADYNDFAYLVMVSNLKMRGYAKRM